MNIVKKIGLGRTLAGIAIAGAAVISGATIANGIKEKQETKEFKQQTDSVMQARGMDIHDINGRLSVQGELMNNQYKEFVYNMACDVYGLDPEVSSSREQIKELDRLKYKIDSIKRDNKALSNEQKINNIRNTLLNTEKPAK